jgi:hypothetical protein
MPGSTELIRRPARRPPRVHFCRHHKRSPITREAAEFVEGERSCLGAPRTKKVRKTYGLLDTIPYEGQQRSG